MIRDRWGPRVHSHAIASAEPLSGSLWHQNGDAAGVVWLLLPLRRERMRGARCRPSIPRITCKGRGAGGSSQIHWLEDPAADKDIAAKRGMEVLGRGDAFFCYGINSELKRAGARSYLVRYQFKSQGDMPASPLLGYQIKCALQ